MLCHQDELCQPLVEMLRALLPDAISLAEEWWNGCWKNLPIQKRTTGQVDVSKARYKFSFQRCSARYIWYGLWRGINAVWYLTSIKKSWPSCRQVPAKSSFPLWHLAQMWRPTVRGRGDFVGGRGSWVRFCAKGMVFLGADEFFVGADWCFLCGAFEACVGREKWGKSRVYGLLTENQYGMCVSWCCCLSLKSMKETCFCQKEEGDIIVIHLWCWKLPRRSKKFFLWLLMLLHYSMRMWGYDTQPTNCQLHTLLFLHSAWS